jgi:hypothetical protein
MQHQEILTLRNTPTGKNYSDNNHNPPWVLSQGKDQSTFDNRRFEPDDRIPYLMHGPKLMNPTTGTGTLLKSYESSRPFFGLFSDDVDQPSKLTSDEKSMFNWHSAPMMYTGHPFNMLASSMEVQVAKDKVTQQQHGSRFLPFPYVDSSPHPSRSKPKHLPFQQCNERTAKDDNYKLFGVSLFGNSKALEPATIHRHSADKPQHEINVASDHLQLLGSDRYLEQLKHPKHARCEEQENIFQASSLYSKDVQGKPEGGSARRCVKVVTYFNAVIE